MVEATAISVDADVDPLMIVRLWDQGDVRNLQAGHGGGPRRLATDSTVLVTRRLLNASEDDYVLGRPTLEPGRPGVTAPPL